jgi:hypothetical protein
VGVRLPPAPQLFTTRTLRGLDRRRALGLEVTAPPLGPGQPADGPAIVTRTLFSPSPREPMTGLPGYAAPAFTDLLVETSYATYR